MNLYLCFYCDSAEVIYESFKPEVVSSAKAALTVLWLSDECSSDQPQPLTLLQVDKSTHTLNDGLFRRAPVCV